MIDNLEDAIAHCKEKARELRERADVFDGLATETDVIQCRECAEEHEQLAGWLEELAERREADRWVSVKEELPEEATMVFVFCKDLYLANLNPCIGWRNGQYWNTFTAKGCTQILYPTYWKPLPNKPYGSEAANDN